MTEEPVLTLTSVSRQFGSGATAVSAVQDATLSMYAGDVIAIVGPSGSGKSTLLSIMGGLLKPDTGEVYVAGSPLRAMSESARARLRRTRIGFIFQKFNLLKALTALENVEVGPRLAGFDAPEVHERATQALREVGLQTRAHALPHDLSGGQQQRVAVARALATEPALILADEPTGSLDSANGRIVLDMICTHVHRCRAAAVIVTHDHRALAFVDRELVMEDGVLTGRPQRVTAAAIEERVSCASH
jgi:putative ABC transport system ATP-binding protein